jgi:hypothetical protein
MAPRSKQHSPIEAGNAKRWMNCPGSVALESKFPASESFYATEGSGAHRLAEKCLLETGESVLAACEEVMTHGTAK